MSMMEDHFASNKKAWLILKNIPLQLLVHCNCLSALIASLSNSSEAAIVITLKHSDREAFWNHNNNKNPFCQCEELITVLNRQHHVQGGGPLWVKQEGLAAAWSGSSSHSQLVFPHSKNQTFLSSIYSVNSAASLLLCQIIRLTNIFLQKKHW